mmetsp:Transcript_31775/g.54195  ORF Transcript_31775/g.54195 Transcript_31775/m.54195 type:complete len:207 (-) Transcript_31775:816-1436(-)
MAMEAVARGARATKTPSNPTTTNPTSPRSGAPTLPNSTSPTVDSGGLPESYAPSNGGDSPWSLESCRPSSQSRVTWPASGSARSSTNTSTTSWNSTPLPRTECRRAEARATRPLRRRITATTRPMDTWTWIRMAFPTPNRVRANRRTSRNIGSTFGTLPSWHSSSTRPSSPLPRRSSCTSNPSAEDPVFLRSSASSMALTCRALCG